MFRPPPAAPFTDFEFAFDPTHFPAPPGPPLPSSADLFTPSETTDLFGFLDNFALDFDHDARPDVHYPAPQLHPAPVALRRPASRSLSSAAAPDIRRTAPSTPPAPPIARPVPTRPSRSSSTSSLPAPRFARSPSRDDDGDDSGSASGRPKPLLSTPQKRLNHIMSEQKRRNAIRDGYAQLISLLAPAGSAQTIAMPSRGRPKGSGSRNKGKTQGKSGVLFRAVEYVHFLEEGRDALLQEVLRLEAAAAAAGHP